MNSKIILFSFLLILILSTGNAQTTATNPFPQDVIKIDQFTHKMEKQVPFDKPFTVVMTVEDVENVIGVNAYEVIYKKAKNGDPGFDPKKSKRKIRDIRMKKVMDSINMVKVNEADAIPGVGFRVDIKQKLLLIEFPALPPNFHFDFVILKKLGGENLRELRKYTDAIADSLIWRNKVGAQKLIYDFYYFAESLKIKSYPGQPTAFYLDTMSFSCDGDRRNLSCFYKTTKLEADYDTLYKFNFTAPMPENTRIVSINTLLRSEKIENLGMTYLYTILRSPNPNLYFNGQLSMKDFPNKGSSVFDLDKRVTNLDTSIFYLKIIRTDLEELALKRPEQQTNIANFADKIDQLLVKFHENRKKMAALSLSINIKISKNVHYSECYTTTTEIRDLQTKSSFIFTPQIGLSLLVTRNNENKINYIPKLNWGININLRAVDKLISRRYITDRTWRHYLSLYVGLTVGGFREKEYENLFNGTSLMIGPSFRINRVFYFSSGLSLYRQKDNNPIINKTKVTTGGYTSLLLDLDFTNAVSTIRNLLLK